MDWFQDRYMDPAEGVPHDSAEGGYQYVNGGPFDAREVLATEFGAVHPDAWIEEAAARIERDGTVWVPQSDY